MVLRVEAWNFGHLTLGLFDNAMVYRQQINLFSRSKPLKLDSYYTT
jgi:hypothetical protein